MHGITDEKFIGKLIDRCVRSVFLCRSRVSVKLECHSETNTAPGLERSGWMMSDVEVTRSRWTTVDTVDWETTTAHTAKTYPSDAVRDSSIETVCRIIICMFLAQAEPAASEWRGSMLGSQRAAVAHAKYLDWWSDGFLQENLRNITFQCYISQVFCALWCILAS